MKGSTYEKGLPPVELWGVSKGPKPEHKPGAIVRSASARARRRAKRAARRASMPLKAYLRKAKP